MGDRAGARGRRGPAAGVILAVVAVVAAVAATDAAVQAWALPYVNFGVAAAVVAVEVAALGLVVAPRGPRRRAWAGFQVGGWLAIVGGAAWSGPGFGGAYLPGGAPGGLVLAVDPPTRWALEAAFDRSPTLFRAWRRLDRAGAAVAVAAAGAAVHLAAVGAAGAAGAWVARRLGGRRAGSPAPGVGERREAECA